MVQSAFDITCNLLCSYAQERQQGFSLQWVALHIQPQMDAYEPPRRDIAQADEYIRYRIGLMGQLQRWWYLSTEMRDVMAYEWMRGRKASGVLMKQLYDAYRKAQWPVYDALSAEVLDSGPRRWRSELPSFSSKPLPGIREYTEMRERLRMR